MFHFILPEGESVSVNGVNISGSTTSNTSSTNTENIPTSVARIVKTPTTNQHIFGMYLVMLFGLLLGIAQGTTYINTYRILGSENKIVNKDYCGDILMIFNSVSSTLGAVSALVVAQILDWGMLNLKSEVAQILDWGIDLCRLLCAEEYSSCEGKKIGS